MIIGIDPGSSGAAAFMASNELLHVVRFIRKTPLQIACELCDAINDVHCTGEPIVYMEFTSSSPQMGVRSAHTFGRKSGQLEGMFAMLGVEPAYVPPRTWQKALGVQPSRKKMGTGNTDHKRTLRRLAEELYPDWKMTADQADAILIAEYGRRLRGGE